MRYRHMGDTNLEISEVGFGCGGNAGLMTRGEPAEQTRAIARALELGVTYFDNSPDYANGRAEENLGRALRELKTRPVINSKVEIREADFGDIAGHVVRSAEASLKRLGVDTLDVFQIHNGPSLVNPNITGKTYTQLWIEDFFRPHGALEGLRRVLDSGKARHGGVICRGNDREAMIRVMDTGLIKMINVPYTLVNPSAGRDAPTGVKSNRDFGGILNAAKARGVGAAIYSPLASGILTEEFAAAQPAHRLARSNAEGEAAERQRRIANSVRFLGRERGMQLPEIGFRFILDHPGVTTAIGGFSDVAQVEQLARVPEMAGFDAAQVRELESVWARNFGNTDVAGGVHT